MSNQHCLAPTDPNAEYLYCASLTPAIIFSVLFGLTTIAHIWQAIRYRKVYCWVVIMGSAWELAGLITRALSTLDQSKRTFYVASLPLVLLAPIWINAFAYICLGRAMHYFLPGVRVWGIKAQWIAVIFVCGDIFAFIVQAASVGISVSGTTTAVQTGLWIYTAGVALQQSFILIFVAVAISFHQQLLRKGTVDRSTSWRRLLWTLYAVLTLITIRIVYRIIEYSMGYTNYVTTHESIYYVFDALPMFGALLVFNIWHPARVLVDEGSGPGGGCCSCCGSKTKRRRRGSMAVENGAQTQRAEDGWKPEQGQRYEMMRPENGKA